MLGERRDAGRWRREVDADGTTIVTSAGNGKELSYLAAHAEIYRQQYDDSRVLIRCRLPRHLLHHIQGPDVAVRFLDEPT